MNANEILALGIRPKPLVSQRESEIHYCMERGTDLAVAMADKTRYGEPIPEKWLSEFRGVTLWYQHLCDPE